MAARRTIRRRWVERIALLFLLSLAWLWIVAVVYLLWHTMTSSPKQQPPSQSNPALVGVHQAVVGQRQPIPSKEASDSHLSRYNSPLVVFTCQRAEYLKQTLSEVMKYIPQSCEIGCPVIVSQDGNNPEVREVIQSFQQSGKVPVIHLEHESVRRSLRGGPSAAYKALAVHYGWALERIFSGKANPTHGKPDRILILEEDLHISPDFFDYFGAMAPLLDSDESILAVSAFNDNGKKGKVRDATRVLRSDFFPGLGWMMTRRLWDQELSSKWPDGYWDDWLREPVQRKGRHILRPEVRRLVSSPLSHLWAT